MTDLNEAIDNLNTKMKRMGSATADAQPKDPGSALSVEQGKQSAQDIRYHLLKSLKDLLTANQDTLLEMEQNNVFEGYLAKGKTSVGTETINDLIKAIDDVCMDKVEPSYYTVERVFRFTQKTIDIVRMHQLGLLGEPKRYEAVFEQQYKKDL